MQRRLITVVLFAVLLAVASSTVLYRIISARSAHASDVALSEIYVAAHDLAPGTLVAEADIRKVKWPGQVNPLWVSRKEDLIGRSLVAAVNNNEPIPDNRLAQKGSGSGVAAGIPGGMRVMPVHVDEQSGLTHIIAAGMHVDVLSTEAAGGLNGPGAVTRTILQNIKVFSTDAPADKNSKERLPGAQSVNLLVTPEQAETLSQAIAQNRIQLALRNPLDQSNITDAVTRALLPAAFVRAKIPADATERPVRAAAAAPAPAAEPAKPAPPTVEIVQGTKRTVMVVAPADGAAGQSVTQGINQ